MADNEFMNGYAIGQSSNDGFGGSNGSWIWLIVILAVLFGWGRGGYGGIGGGMDGSGAAANYVLTSDFSQLSRQMDSGFASQERRTDSIINGLCSIGYDNLAQANGINMNVMQTGYGITNAINGVGTQLADCCCRTQQNIKDVNYNLATQANGLSRDVERGFCDTQYRDAMNTNGIMQAGHADADRIIAKLDAMENARKDEKIAAQDREIFQWQLRSSQSEQTAQILRELGYQCPKPAYVVQPPQQVTFPTNCCGGVNYAAYSNNGCGSNCM